MGGYVLAMMSFECSEVRKGRKFRREKNDHLSLIAKKSPLQNWTIWQKLCNQKKSSQ